jgi:1-acyl-sn-glycerol-3-phosphate acyltransferase
MRTAPRTDPRARRFAAWLLSLLFDRYFHTHVLGREHVPTEGTPTLVTSNHTSALDVFAGGYAVGRPGYFLAKAEAVRVPIAGRFLRAVGAIPAARDGRDIAALKEMVAVLEGGHMLGVAPEGTRGTGGDLLPYDPGFVWLARRTGAVVIPCAILGTRELMPVGRLLPRRGDIWVAFGAPADVGEATGLEHDAAAEAVRGRTRELLDTLERARSGAVAPTASSTVPAGGRVRESEAP